MERSFWSTIRGKLLSRTLVVVMVPVLVISGAAIYALRSLSSTADSTVVEAREALTEEVVGTRIAQSAEQVSREIAIFVDERLHDVEGWSSDAAFVRAAQAGTARANLLGLPGMDAAEAEAMFEANPRLGTQGTGIAQTLADVVAGDSAFTEVLVTDVNGFNVEYSSRTADFVQSDELWWTNAMTSGSDISEPVFDQSAGVFAIDIAKRIDLDGAPIGVLRASLDLSVVQPMTDRHTGTVEAFEVSVLDSSWRLLAETASGHNPDHIMNESYLAAVGGEPNPRISIASDADRTVLYPDNFSIHADALGGYNTIAEQLLWIRGEMDASIAAFDWTVVVEQPSDVAFSALTPLEGLTGELSRTSSTLMIIVGMMALAGALLAALVALVAGRRLASPIMQLRDAAVEAAEVTLPNVVAQIESMDEEDEIPELAPLALETGDEVEDLAQAFNAAQQTAANLAGEQARLRRKNVATTFVNMGRRNQNLIARQLEHINSMENSETDPAMLKRLFQLDHLATRMRRNAESLLVLAGEETPRRFRQPVSMHQLVQAAGAEIEDFSRIQFGKVDEVGIEGTVASDVAHLLAELLENASSFSPPGTLIQIHGRSRDDGYWLAVVDQGIGMSADEMQLSNAQLANPADFDRAPSAYLGHFVVGHLAKRHGVRVELMATPDGGLTAHLLLPPAVLVEASSAFPASEVVAEASPHTHVAVANDESVRQIANMAATPGTADATVDMRFDMPVDEGDPAATLESGRLDVPLPAESVEPEPESPPEPQTPPPALDLAVDAPAAAPRRAPSPAPPALDRAVDAPPAAPAAPRTEPQSTPPPAAQRPSIAEPADTPTMQAPPPASRPAVPPAAVAPAPAPAAPAPTPEPGIPAPADPPETEAVEVAPAIPPAPTRPPAVAPGAAPPPRPRPAPAGLGSWSATGPASKPTSNSAAHRAQPPVLMSSLVEPKKEEANETTSSGFRKRRRGQEGAPAKSSSAGRLNPNPPRRNPADVQASLARFRRGVEAGRAHTTDPQSAPDDHAHRGGS